MSGLASFGSHGVFDSALAVETEPVVTAARALDALGLDALQKASLFGNVTALFAMKSGLTRAKYLRLCRMLWAETAVQMAVIEVTDEGVSPASLSPGGQG